MEITNIRESGANNLLMWAINNGADIKDDTQLQSIINDELFYLVTLNDINFMELFRLTQMYREKLRILTEKKAMLPPRNEIVSLFSGSYILDPKDPETKSPMYELVEGVIESFINLALQMGNDDDIIKPSALRLFLPMISRKFDVQIPVSFIDLMDSISPDESERLFTSEYPATLNDIIEAEIHGFKTKLTLGFLKGTSIIKYNQRYDKYLRITRYSPLKTCKNEKLYKYGILGFWKYDETSRAEVRCSLFNPNNELLGATLKRLSKLRTPLHIDFAIQLPIQYMQMLENSFDQDILKVSYEASMATIIDGGIVYNDFITQELTDENDPAAVKAYEDYTNNINAYRVRIAESNQLLLNAIPLLLDGDDNNDVDVTSVFAMLPSIYMTKAVVSLNLDHTKKYLSHYDPVIVEMFSDMLDVASSITSDINKEK